MAEGSRKRVQRIFGYVRQAGTSVGVSGAVVRVYRLANGSWQRLATLATDALGYWECDVPAEPVDEIRITEENPPDHGDGGWPSVPLGALVRGLNAVHWPHPNLRHCGPVIFYDLSFRLLARLCPKRGTS